MFRYLFNPIVRPHAQIFPHRFASAIFSTIQTKIVVNAIIVIHEVSCSFRARHQSAFVRWMIYDRRPPKHPNCDDEPNDKPNNGPYVNKNKLFHAVGITLILF
jgi:hypothetical protein